MNLTNKIKKAVLKDGALDPEFLVKPDSPRSKQEFFTKILQLPEEKATMLEEYPAKSGVR